MLLGVLLASSVVDAPVLAYFYHEPRLFWVTIVLAAGLFSPGRRAACRHPSSAMRYVAQVAIEAMIFVATPAHFAWAADLAIGPRLGTIFGRGVTPPLCGRS